MNKIKYTKLKFLPISSNFQEPKQIIKHML